MIRDRRLRYLGLGAGLALVVIVAAVAFISLQSPFQPSQNSPGSSPCTPQPCGNERGFIVWVTDVKADSALVTMMLTFQNSSSSTHADPSEFSLLDAHGQESQPVYDSAACPHWPRSEFNNGARFGPVAECFRPASTAPPMKLRWNPDFGFFCCRLDIKLTAG